MVARQYTTTKKFARYGMGYAAYYIGDKLVQLMNETTGVDIPSTTKSFRRLADNNRGNKFQTA